MESDESVEHRAALALARESESDPASRLEAAELAAELVPLLPAEPLDVRFESVGKHHSRRRHEAIDPHVVAGAAERA